MEPSFEVVCNTDTSPAKPYLHLLNAEIVELNSSRIIVNNMNISSNCHNLSDYQLDRSLTIDLSKTQYRFSDGNWITTTGCNVMSVGVIGERVQSSIRSSCSAICSDGMSNSYECLYGQTSYAGDGCCVVPIPRGNNQLMFCL